MIATKGLKGNIYKFPKVTVTGSENLIMASVFNKGSHILYNVSIEPDVKDLIDYGTSNIVKESMIKSISGFK